MSAGLPSTSGETQPAGPGLDPSRQVRPLQLAMDHHRHEELLLLAEVVEAEIAQHRRELAHRIAQERSCIALHAPLEREQPGLEQVGAHDRGVLDQQALPADPGHLGQQGLPALDMRQQPDADHEIEGPIGERQGPEARCDEMQPALGLVHQEREALGAGWRAALDPDLEAQRQQQAGQLGMAATDVEHAPRPRAGHATRGAARPRPERPADRRRPAPRSGGHRPRRRSRCRAWWCHDPVYADDCDPPPCPNRLDDWFPDIAPRAPAA